MKSLDEIAHGMRATTLDAHQRHEVAEYVQREIAQNNDGELRKLFLETTSKLAAVTATLGVPGDESVAVLTATAKKLVEDRATLFSSAADLALGAQASMGQYWVLAEAFEKLIAAIDSARKPA